jgi:hypothetical protein
MMRGQEIVAAISWGSDLHPNTITEIEAAILDLDRRAYGNNRPQINGIAACAKLEKFIKACGSANVAAGKLGISKGLLSDIRNARRPIPDGVCRMLGLVKRQPGATSIWRCENGSNHDYRARSFHGCARAHHDGRLEQMCRRRP